MGSQSFDVSLTDVKGSIRVARGLRSLLFNTPYLMTAVVPPLALRSRKRGKQRRAFPETRLRMSDLR